MRKEREKSDKGYRVRRRRLAKKETIIFRRNKVRKRETEKGKSVVGENKEIEIQRKRNRVKREKFVCEKREIEKN